MQKLLQSKVKIKLSRHAVQASRVEERQLRIILNMVYNFYLEN
jgi:hypothetical protein